MFSFLLLSFISYILNNRQKLTAQPLYNPDGQLSSSYPKTMQNKSPRRKKKKSRTRKQKTLIKSSWPQPHLHKQQEVLFIICPQPLKVGHNQTPHSTGEKNNAANASWAIRHQCGKHGRELYGMHNIHLNSHSEFPFFTTECYSSLQVKSLTLKDIKVIKLLH